MIPVKIVLISCLSFVGYRVPGDMTITVMSFAFPSGLPEVEAGTRLFIFDCRELPDPYFESGLAKLSGLAPEVQAFFRKRSRKIGPFIHSIEMVVKESVSACAANDDSVVFAFGCTGGHHRSVYCANMIAGYLRKQGVLGVKEVHTELGMNGRPDDGGSVTTKEELGIYFHEWQSPEARRFLRELGVSIRNWRIFTRRKGMADGESWTYARLADSEGISRPRAKQIVDRTGELLKVRFKCGKFSGANA